MAGEIGWPLSDHRRDLVMHRTRICCKVRWFLPAPTLIWPRLPRPAAPVRVAAIFAALDRFDGVVARLTRELLERCQDLNRQVSALKHELGDLVRPLAPNLVDSYGALSPDGARHFPAVFEKLSPAIVHTQTRLDDLSGISAPMLVMVAADDLVSLCNTSRRWARPPRRRAGRQADAHPVTASTGGGRAGGVY